MWPEIEIRRVPGVFSVPTLLNAAPPLLMIHAMFDRVSTLLMTVGRWYKPRTVSRGGRLVQVRGDTELRAGDEVLALAEEGDHPDHLFEPTR